MDGRLGTGIDEHDIEEVTLVARGIATAVAPETGLTEVQAELLQAIAAALTGYDVDYLSLEPLAPADLADVLAPHDLALPPAHRPPHGARRAGAPADPGRRRAPRRQVRRGARREGQLRARRAPLRAGRVRPGVDGPGAQRVRRARPERRRRERDGAEAVTDRARPTSTPSSRRSGRRSPSCRHDTLGYQVWDMYDSRGFEVPGAPGGPPVGLAQHDFVHVLADYGTNLRGEVEVFALIGRADPDPKGFAWLATLIGLFETGYITSSGFFDRDVRDPVIQAPGMHVRVADGIRRGKVVWQRCDMDLFDFDYHVHATLPVDEVREIVGVPPKSEAALAAGSAALCSFEGMSETQRRIVSRTQGRRRVNLNFTQAMSVKCSDPEKMEQLVELLRQWDRDQAQTDIMGYMGIRILADRETPHEYLILADFGVVDPDVSAADEAARNNERPETQETARRMRELLDDDPVYRHYDWMYLTDG